MVSTYFWPYGSLRSYMFGLCFSLLFIPTVDYEQAAEDDLNDTFAALETINSNTGALRYSSSDSDLHNSQSIMS